MSTPITISTAVIDTFVDGALDAVVIIQGGIIDAVNASLNAALDAVNTALDAASDAAMGVSMIWHSFSNLSLHSSIKMNSDFL